MRLLSPPDPYTETCFDLGNANQTEVLNTFSVDIRERTTYAGALPTAHVWVDDCLAPEVRTVVEDWIVGTGQLGYRGDLAFLSARVGTGASTQPTSIWIGRSEVRTEGSVHTMFKGGYTTGSSVRIKPIDSDGTLGTDTAEGLAQQLDSTATHELAHLVLNDRVYGEPGVKWFDESAASLLGYERQPGAEPQRLYEGLFQRVNAFVFDEDDAVLPLRDLTSVALNPNVTFEQYYAVGPYLLAQVGAAAVGNDSVALWNAIGASVRSAPYDQPYTTAELRTVLETGLGTPLPGASTRASRVRPSASHSSGSAGSTSTAGRTERSSWSRCRPTSCRTSARSSRPSPTCPSPSRARRSTGRPRSTSVPPQAQRGRAPSRGWTRHP